MAGDKFKFVLFFLILGLIALNVPFTKLAGSNVSFTLFDFFAPIAGAFLGPILGVVTVLGIEIANIVVKQTPLTTGTIIRLFPVLFATVYFALMAKGKTNKEKSGNVKFILIVPFLSIIAFLAHPIGRTVPYFTLFWIIPFVSYIFRKNLFMRSLGSTFTQHAVGGAAWIWAFNLPANVWQGLIPVVIQERLVFAVGIMLSYKLLQVILSALAKANLLPTVQKINPHYK